MERTRQDVKWGNHKYNRYTP